MSDFNTNRRVRRALQAGAIVAAIGGGYAARDMNVVAQGGSEATAPPAQKAPVVQTASTRDAVSMQGAFADVAAAVEPAVVTITNAGSREPASASSQNPRGRNPRSRPFGQGQNAPLPGGEGFNGGDLQEFFKQFQRQFGFNNQSFNADNWQGRVLRDKWADARAQFIQQGPGPGAAPGGRSGGGLGSGMIYRADGLILTNAHVVKGASTVAVTLSDGRHFDKAKVLGRDEKTDIAVVKIEATGLPTVKLGDSSEPRVGDWAIAVGNPFGLDHTLTVGVISAKARQLRLADDARTDYLQTDASINPGNSGGPLLDIYGRVIGINNAIYSESGGNQGIGFAIPVNTARFVADRIVRDGRVRRSKLGVVILPVDAETAPGLGLDSKLKGVLIAEVPDPNTSGAKAGLQAGDVVTELNGKAVTTSSELQTLVGNSPIGSQATLTVVRKGSPLNLTATLEELKDETPERAAQPEAPRPAATRGETSVIPGLKLKNMSLEVARALGIPLVKGVAIIDVTDGSAADSADLRRGDVIQRVGASTPVTGVADLSSAVASILNGQTGDNKKVALYVNRGGQSSYVFVTIE